MPKSMVAIATQVLEMTVFFLAAALLANGMLGFR